MPRGVLLGEPDILGAPPYERRPGERSLVVARDPVSGGMVPVAARWGVLPAPAQDRYILQVPADRFLRKRIASRTRCLVPMGGYIQRGVRRTPIRVTFIDEVSLAVAAVWESGPSGPSFAIVTMEAVQPLAPAHDRMPLLLRPELWPLWLEDRPLTASELAEVQRPAPPMWLRTQKLRRLPEKGTSEPVSRQLDELIPGVCLWNPPDWGRPQPVLRVVPNHAAEVKGLASFHRCDQ